MSKNQVPVVLKVDNTIQLLNNCGHPGLYRAHIHQAPQLILSDSVSKDVFSVRRVLRRFVSIWTWRDAGEQSIKKKTKLICFYFLFPADFLFFSFRWSWAFAWQQTSPCAQTRHFQIWFWWPNLAIIILPTFPYVSPRVVVLLWSFFFCYAREFGIVAVIWWCLRQVKIRRAMLMHYWP